MIKSKLREIAIVLTSLIILSGGLGTDAAYAREVAFPTSGLDLTTQLVTSVEGNIGPHTTRFRRSNRASNGIQVAEIFAKAAVLDLTRSRE